MVVVVRCSAAVSITLSSCGSSTETPDVRILTEQDSGSYVELIVGQNVQVLLSANPTTGYTLESQRGRRRGA